MRSYQKAIQLFNDASSTYPASVTAQSAFIALQTRKDDTLFRTFSSILSHEASLKLIKLAAETRHKEGKRLRPESKAPIEIEDGLIESVLHTVITRSNVMRKLKPEELKEILDQYFNYERNQAGEMQYELMVEKTYLTRINNDEQEMSYGFRWRRS